MTTVRVCFSAWWQDPSKRETAAGAGVFGVEMFVVEGGELLLNEVAPRPHNSGHYTIESCNTSQFEQHLRAVLGLPLGCTEMRVASGWSALTLSHYLPCWVNTALHCPVGCAGGYSKCKDKGDIYMQLELVLGSMILEINPTNLTSNWSLQARDFVLGPGHVSKSLT